MKEKEILKLTKENLERNSHFKIEWSVKQQKYLDALIKIIWDNDKSLSFHAEVKEKVGPQHLEQIKQISKKIENFLLVSWSLSPNIKKKLQQESISYLEANGNLFLKNSNTFLFIDINKPLTLKSEKGNRAFTRTGLKVLFHFLVFPEWINQSYREIAENTNTSLGNVSNILNSLEDSGFLLRKNKDELIWNKRKQLLNKWIDYYEERLKPSLAIGSFRFKNEDLLNSWKTIELKSGQSWWGSEPAAELLTNYLNPGEWTIYTKETQQDLLKNYHLIPDPKGKVHVYRAFWNFEVSEPAAPPLLVYTDLVNTENSRCLETADLIFKGHLDADF